VRAGGWGKYRFSFFCGAFCEARPAEGGASE